MFSVYTKIFKILLHFLSIFINYQLHKYKSIFIKTQIDRDGYHQNNLCNYYCVNIKTVRAYYRLF